MDATDTPADELGYDDLIEQDAPGESEDAADELNAADEAKRRRPVWPFLILLGALIGFGASFAASWMTRPAPFDPAPLRAEIGALKAEVTALASRPEAEMPSVDLGPIQRRLRALETAPDPAPIGAELVERLEALQAEGLDLPPPVDLAPLIGRIEALEARRGAVVSEPMPLDPDVKLPAFPAGKLREGAYARRGGGLLSRHIRVRSDDDPLTLIDDIEADLAARRVAEAVATFDRLPAELQSLAQGWRADMESFLP